jgi:hypothetical protein
MIEGPENGGTVTDAAMCLLAVKLLCRFGDGLALVARAREFIRARLAAAVAIGDRSRAIRVPPPVTSFTPI